MQLHLQPERYNLIDGRRVEAPSFLPKTLTVLGKEPATNYETSVLRSMVYTGPLKVYEHRYNFVYAYSLKEPMYYKSKILELNITLALAYSGFAPVFTLC